MRTGAAGRVLQCRAAAVSAKSLGSLDLASHGQLAGMQKAVMGQLRERRATSRNAKSCHVTAGRGKGNKQGCKTLSFESFRLQQAAAEKGN